MQCIPKLLCMCAILTCVFLLNIHVFIFYDVSENWCHVNVDKLCIPIVLIVSEHYDVLKGCFNQLFMTTSTIYVHLKTVYR